VEPSSFESPADAQQSSVGRSTQSGGLRGFQLTGVVHRYECKRWWHRVDVEFNDSELLWSFRSLGSQWRERLPLAILVPYPTATTDHREMRSSLLLLLVSCIGTGFLAWLDSNRLEVSPGTIIAGICACLIAAYIAWCWWRGPLEWVVFTSHFPDKRVYYWQTLPGDAFAAFTDRLRDAILAANGGAIDHVLNNHDLNEGPE
jgi:hypothetical protein